LTASAPDATFEIGSSLPIQAAAQVMPDGSWNNAAAALIVELGERLAAVAKRLLVQIFSLEMRGFYAFGLVLVQRYSDGRGIAGLWAGAG